MRATITVRRLESVPDDATIRDFDELSDSIKQRIAAATTTGDASVAVSDDDRASIDSFDVVRFTGYYRVERSAATLEGRDGNRCEAK